MKTDQDELIKLINQVAGSNKQNLFEFNLKIASLSIDAKGS
jgi:hypothetical protein